MRASAVRLFLLLKKSDDKRFGSILKSLKEGSYLSRDEYPVTSSAIYELMVKHSGLLGSQQRRGNERDSSSRNFSGQGTPK